MRSNSWLEAPAAPVMNIFITFCRDSNVHFKRWAKMQRLPQVFCVSTVPHQLWHINS